MGTVVTIEVVGVFPHDQQLPDESASQDQESAQGLEPSTEALDCEEAVGRAFTWFEEIEDCCTRFQQQSEVMRLTALTGIAMPVSDLLFEVVKFALAVAEQTGGAFDPTVGYEMEQRGFNREYRTRQIVRTNLKMDADSVSYRDVYLDPEQKAITLQQPLILDLGAVAKGLAVDMAARELQSFRNFAVNAGGDLYLSGCNRKGNPWSIGIRHPRVHDEIIDELQVSDWAVCTSGNYERTSADGKGKHHIIDPRTKESPQSVASVTVLAPTAMLADALATTAFVLGPADGLKLLEKVGVEGLIFTPALERYVTAGLCKAGGNGQ
jgi:thiamine biosynthesis lipoprotein